MENEQRFLLDCIEYQFGDRDEPSSEGIDLAKLCSFAEKQSLLPYVYYSVKGIQDKMILASLKKRINIILAKDAMLMSDANEILKIFNECGIRCLPLKGYVVKRYYPKSRFRFASDFDVLVDKEAIKEAHASLLKLGFKRYGVGGHHWVYIHKSTKTCVELHFSLFEDGEQICFNFSIDDAQSINGELSFSNEDFYVYLLAHYANHFYQSAGVGIRCVTDVYAFLKKVQLNRDVVEKKLAEAKLFKFADSIEKLVRVWFYGETTTEELVKLERIIFSSNVLSNDSLMAIQRVNMHKGNRFKAILREIFPSYNRMKCCFTWLKNFPFLLPIAYPIRWIKTLLFRREQLGRLNSIANVNSRESNEYNEVKVLLGLDEFN